MEVKEVAVRNILKSNLRYLYDWNTAGLARFILLKSEIGGEVLLNGTETGLKIAKGGSLKVQGIMQSVEAGSKIRIGACHKIEERTKKIVDNDISRGLMYYEITERVNSVVVGSTDGVFNLAVRDGNGKVYPATESVTSAGWEQIRSGYSIELAVYDPAIQASRKIL
jgi:hypothetical protein